jgi:hypothetical protein
MKSEAISRSTTGPIVIVIAILCSVPVVKLLNAQSGSATTSTPSKQSPEVSFQPNAVAVGVGVVPGAVVCQDLATVRLVSSLYADY